MGVTQFVIVESVIDFVLTCRERTVFQVKTGGRFVAYSVSFSIKVTRIDQ